MLRYLQQGSGTPLTAFLRQNSLSLIGAVTLAYVLLLIILDIDKFIQFTLNSIATGSIYSMLAIGFSLVFGTVWFFDLAYGVLPAVGAYYVFNYHPSGGVGVNLPLAGGVGAVFAGSFGWMLYALFYAPLRRRFSAHVLLSAGAILVAGVGVYTGFFFTQPDDLHIYVAPVVGFLVTATALWVLYKTVLQRLPKSAPSSTAVTTALIVLAIAAVLGAYCGYLMSQTDDSNLPVSVVLGIVFAGCVGLILYRGLYYYLRRRARSPLIMIVASLGVLLMLQALISIVFNVSPRAFPDPFGDSPISIFSGSIKPYQLFNVGLAAGLVALLIWMQKKTSFGKAIRAIGDDEEVARVVGINTPVVIAGVFFLGAAIAALAGISLGLDLNTIQPRMGFLPLFKGWIAAVIGGTGNLYGALLGGFLLGMAENYGVWFVGVEWKDAIAFIVFIFFLLLRPRGLLPRT